MYGTKFHERSSVRMKTIFGRLFEADWAGVPCTTATGWGGRAGDSCSLRWDGCVAGCARLGFLALHAATIFESTCGRGLLVRFGCAVPCIIGRVQSTRSPVL